MSMLNMQRDSAGRNVIGPADTQPQRQPEKMATLYNLGFDAGTLLEINHSVVRMPEKGKAFAIPQRNARLFLRLYGRRSGGRPGVATRPDGSNAKETPKAPPGFRLVPDAEYNRLVGETKSEGSPAIVPDRVRILEEEKAAAVKAKAEELAAAKATVEDEDEVELDFVSGDIPDEIVTAHNAVEVEEELDGILDDLGDLDN